MIPPKILEKIHNEQILILHEIVKLCQKHNITYFLVGGTMLGAIRHHGFIPWDDDLDIGMPREDYSKFVEICKNGGLSEDFILHHQCTDNNYWLPFAKNSKKTYTPH